MARNPRYYGPGGWRARERALRIVRDRAASGEPCGICGKPIDLDAPQWIVEGGKRKRAPWSLECDEIVPVSRGGSPTDPDNIRPAHRVCNQRRGAGRAIAVPHEAAEGRDAGRW